MVLGFFNHVLMIFIIITCYNSFSNTYNSYEDTYSVTFISIDYFNRFPGDSQHTELQLFQNSINLDKLCHVSSFGLIFDIVVFLELDGFFIEKKLDGFICMGTLLKNA